MSRIEATFTDGPAFIPYLAAGDPDYETSLGYVNALERGGADIIELGLPFSEPIAEGPTIQGAVRRALEAGMTPERFFDFVEDLSVTVPLVCMTYYNLIYQFGSKSGPSPFIERAADAGIDGIIVPDLPAEESDPLRQACVANGLDLIFIIAPTTRGDRLEKIKSRISGYVYVQARLGTTGARASLSEQTAETLDRIAHWNIPKAVGFGVSEPEHARDIIAAGADGVIAGSVLVDIVAATEDDSDFIESRLEDVVRSLKAGTVAGAEKQTGSERT